MRETRPAPPDWVLDTNVVVSAFLSPKGKPATLLEAAFAGRFRICYDARIIAEYADVLRRPRFGFDASMTASFLGFAIQGKGVKVITTAPFALADPGDQPFAEVAFTNHPPVVVTGNVRDYAAAVPFGLHVLTPAQALAELGL